MASKELKKGKLYLLNVEIPYEDNEGNDVVEREWIVGYVTGEKDRFFYGSIYSREEGNISGGDIVSLSVEQFNGWVKAIKEIA